MKKIVVYKSKSGYTKKYAEWIAEELECDLRLASDVTIEDLIKYDLIVYGGGLYAMGVNGLSLIKKNYHLLKDKKIVVWATGANPGREDEIKNLWQRNLTSEQLSTIKTFYLRGGFDYKLLKTGDKILMSMLKISLKRKKHKTEDDEGMLKAYDIPEYHCDKENIRDLINYIRQE